MFVMFNFSRFTVHGSRFTVHGSRFTQEVHVFSVIRKIFGNGVQRPSQQLSRNDECWCGSGKKYKRCHLDKDMARDRLKADACRTGS
jgi:uncharacterized protein YchJ